jgi:hypothetical protein
MSRRYLERMSIRIASGANDLVKLWSAKTQALGSTAFDAELDLQLATMVSTDMVVSRPEIALTPVLIVDRMPLVSHSWLSHYVFNPNIYMA